MKKLILNFCSIFGPRKFIPIIKPIFKGNPIFFIPTQKKICFLTLDDVPGEDELINQNLLEILKLFNVKATFFMISSQITENHHLFMQKLLTDGHEIANHMHNNEPVLLYSKEKFERDLLKCEKILNFYEKNFSKRDIKLFRPPYGKISNDMVKILKKNKYIIVLGDLYSYDYYITDPAFHVNYLTKNLNQGSIIILHFPSKKKNYQTLEILREIIPSFQREGYQFELLREVLEKQL